MEVFDVNIGPRFMERFKIDTSRVDAISIFISKAFLNTTSSI